MHSLERTFHRCFLPSFSSFGWGFSEENIKMWKVNGWQTTDTKWWQKLILSLARFAKKNIKMWIPIVQTENAISAILSRKISTVRGPSRWFNADHDRGQILSFSSPSRNHVDRGWSRIRRAQWANVFYKPTCTKYLGRIKFALKINANVVIFIACGIW